MAGGIFVSYRRDDAAHVTGRIADALSARFGRERIFMDVDSVAPGEDFVRKIQTSIEESRVFLAVIGPNWLNAATAAGARRIDLPGDFIRLEVVSALAAGVRIIPVLVDGASMPRAEDLPEDVQQLVRHNAVQINHTTFTRDVDHLVGQLAAPGLRKRLMSPAVIAVAAGVVAVAALGVALWPRAGEAAGAASGLTTTVSLRESDRAGGDRFIGWVDYRAERNAAGELAVLTDWPYVQRLRDEHRIDGSQFSSEPFQAAMPTLVIQMTNDTDAPVTINELRFGVASADPDLSPVPVVRENAFDYQIVSLFNEGWGEMTSPRLTVTAWGLPEERRDVAMRRSATGLLNWEPCADPAELVRPPAVTVMGKASGDELGGAVFDLAGRIPPAFKKALFVCAVGELTYSHAGGEETLAVRTRVSNHRPMTLVAAPSIGLFDLYLDPDKEDYVALVPVLREIAPGATDTIEIKVLTDSSSRFSLNQSVRLADGTVVAGEAFSLQILVPRNGGVGRYRLNETSRYAAPDAAIRAVDRRGQIAFVSYDPQGRDEAEFHFREPTDREACAKFLDVLGPSILAGAGADLVDMAGFDPDGAYVCDVRLDATDR